MACWLRVDCQCHGTTQSVKHLPFSRKQNFRRMRPAIGQFIKTCLHTPSSILSSIHPALLRIGRQPIPLKQATAKEYTAASASVSGLVLVEKRTPKTRDEFITPGYRLAGSIPHETTRKTISQGAPRSLTATYICACSTSLSADAVGCHCRALPDSTSRGVLYHTEAFPMWRKKSPLESRDQMAREKGSTVTF